MSDETVGVAAPAENIPAKKVLSPVEQSRHDRHLESAKRSQRKRALEKKIVKAKKFLAAQERLAAKMILAEEESRIAEESSAAEEIMAAEELVVTEERLAAEEPSPANVNNLTPTDEANANPTDHGVAVIADPPAAVHEDIAVAGETKVSFPAALKKIEITDHGILLTTDSFPDDLAALTKFLEQDAVMTLELPTANIK